MAAGKIPVSRTIGYAYSFTIGNFLNIVGIAWLPLALAAAAGYLLIAPNIEAFRMAADTQDLSAMGMFMVNMFLLFVIIWILFAMISVGVTRRALGMDSGPAFFYFSLGGAVWKLIAAYIAYFVIVAVISMIGFAVLGIIGAAVGVSMGGSDMNLEGAGIVGIVFAVLMLAFYVFLVFVALRLVFLLPAVVVAENRIGITRSWTLSRGNVWRIFAIILAIYIPILIVEIVVIAALGGSMMMMASDDPAATMDFMMRNAIILAAVYVLFVVLAIGLTAGASVGAYRALTEGEGASAG